jgi:hypothetical protein
MSSPSTTAERPTTPGTGSAKPSPIPPLSHGRDDISGEPVTDLPELIEPVFEPELELAHGPRSALPVPSKPVLAPPVTPPATPPIIPTAHIAAPAHVELVEIPQIVEPEPAKPEPEAEKPLPVTAEPVEHLAVPAVKAPEERPAERDQLRPAPVRKAFFANRRVRLAVLGVAGIVVLAVIVLVAYRLEIGPFARVRHYPVAAAPSDPAKRFAYFDEGAKAGDTEAALQLAILYAKGEGVTQDYATAAYWFGAAANQGLPRAQYDMGVLTERGRGVKVDLPAAAEWYLKAAQAGYPLAQFNLAVCYTKGQGIRQDLSEAALWYRRAATQGVVQAMINLATMYEKGDGVTASPVDAYAWYLAAEQRGGQTAPRRAEDLYAGMPQLDQIRAKALAADVAASIHDPGHGDNSETSGAASR